MSKSNINLKLANKANEGMEKLVSDISHKDSFVQPPPQSSNPKTRHNPSTEQLLTLLLEEQRKTNQLLEKLIEIAV